MTFLRAIRDDLVEKKLWPVAVALLLALVAIPVLLARGSDEVPEPILPDPNAAVAPVTGQATDPADPVVLAEAATAKVRPTGRFKDPFRSPSGGGSGTAPATDGAAVTVDPETPVPVPGGGAGGPSMDAGDLPGATTTGTGSAEPAIVEPSAPAVEPSEPVADDGHAAGYRVDLDWGPATATRSLRDVTRLQALEAGDEPQVAFMGVRPDGKTALFLLVGDVSGSGDARCRPSEDYCSLLEMKAGETQFLDIVTADGVRQYELSVARVAEKRAATAQAAEKRLAEVAKGGRKLVADTIEGGRTFVRRYVYSKSLGVLKFAESDDEQRAATRGVLEAAE
jgi:hypothetical protein